MFACKKKCKAVSIFILLIFLFSLAGPSLFFTNIKAPVAEAAPSQTLGDLAIGVKVVDKSWEWESRTGDAYTYTGTGDTKPVTWIVVAKDHYGTGSGVTLLTEELIGKFPFDVSVEDPHSTSSSHWGNSGTLTNRSASTVTAGLRPWLNSTGIHAGEGFYRTFSASFKSAVSTTTIPNMSRDSGFGDTVRPGTAYETHDNVFIPTTTELGRTDCNSQHGYAIGVAYPYFVNAVNDDRIAALPGHAGVGYWNRSPSSFNGHRVHLVSSYPAGSFAINLANLAYYGVRPALNLAAETPVSGSVNAAGAFEFLFNTFTVYFKSNGGSAVDSQTIANGATAAEPAVPPTKGGYSFAGWYTDTALTIAYNFNTPVTAVFTLYARWTPAYTVTYSGNNNTSGTAPVDNNQYAAGATVTVAGNTGNLEKTDHTFAGWNTAADGNGTSYAPGTTFTMGAANIILYARWFTITNTNLTPGTISQPYQAQLAAAGGNAPYTWSAGGLPDGLSVNTTTGVISGTPGLNSAGQYNVALTATDNTGATATKTLTLHIASQTGNGAFLVTPDSNAAYSAGIAEGLIPTMTVNEGFSGFTYFSITVSKVTGHSGKEVAVFVHLRDGAQLGLSAVKADFDTLDNAQAAFNVQPGDIIKTYIVDDLNNDPAQSPTIL